jgi:hypothetical protein
VAVNVFLHHTDSTHVVAGSTFGKRLDGSNIFTSNTVANPTRSSEEYAAGLKDGQLELEIWELHDANT